MRIALLLLALTPAAQASDVWTVSPHGGADFTDLAPAVAAAADGDVILIAPGNYGFQQTVSTSKALDLIATGTGRVSGLNLHVTSTAAGSTFAVRNWVATSDTQFRFEDCDGSIRLNGCRTGPWFPFGGQTLSLEVFGCPDVSLTDGLFLGVTGDAGTNWQCGSCSGAGCDGGTALFAQGSAIHAYRCTFVGGHGGQGIWGVLGDCGDGGDGGTGAQLAQCTLTGAECTFLGGEPGHGDPPGGHPGSMGSPMLGGTFVTAITPPCALAAPELVAEGQAYDLRVEGDAGSGVLLLISTATDFRPFGIFVGNLLVDPPFTVQAAGSIGASGELIVPFVAPGLGQGTDARVQRLQAVVIGPGARYLTNPSSLAVIDAGIVVP